MTKKGLVSIALVLGLIVVATAALAHGPGYGRGYGKTGPGYGMTGPSYGRWNMPGANVDSKYFEETAELRNELYRKHQELNAVLAAPEVDQAKAKSLQSEINTLRGQLSEKRLAADLKFRKNNPNYRPGYGRRGGPAYGPGYCWQ